MNIMLVLALKVMTFVALDNGRTAPQPLPASPCMAADAYTRFHVASLREIVRSTDPDTVEWRTTIQLPAASDSSVVVVSDSATCARGLAAYNSVISDTTVTSLYLIRVSTVFVASNPKLRAGEFV